MGSLRGDVHETDLVFDLQVQMLKNSKCSKHSDTRFSIEIASLRQDIWRKNGEKAGDPHEEDDRRDDKDVTETIRWIDTDVMAADPLTKVMEPIKLVHVMETNELDVKQPIDSIVKKRATQLQNRKRIPLMRIPKRTTARRYASILNLTALLSFDNTKTAIGVIQCLNRCVYKMCALFEQCSLRLVPALQTALLSQAGERQNETSLAPVSHQHSPYAACLRTCSQSEVVARGSWYQFVRAGRTGRPPNKWPILAALVLKLNRNILISSVPCVLSEVF